MVQASSFMSDLRSRHDMDFLASKEISVRKWDIEEITWDTKGNVELECNKSMKDMRQWISKISENEEVVVFAIANRQQWNAIIHHSPSCYKPTTDRMKTMNVM